MKLKIGKFKIESCSGGYTIIETMIAISIFIIVVMTGMGSLLNANVIHQKAQDQRSIMDNLSFIMEDLSRNLRLGSKYYCVTGADPLSNVSIAKSSPSGANCWGIAFEPAGGSTSNPNDQWMYYIDSNGALFKSIQGPYNSTSNYTQLTPEEVKINPVSGFLVLGAEAPSDTQQPFVIIRLVGTITYKNVVTPFSLETSVTERTPDI